MRTDPDSCAPATDDEVPRITFVAPVLLGFLLFHFVAVGLYVCPPNPLSIAAKPWVQAYLLPHFGQRWQLFAPDPGGRNEAIHVRCHLREGDVERLTDWIDVTEPLLRAHQRNRFGAPSRMLRAFRPRITVSRELERRAVRHLDGELAATATALLDEEAAAVLERGRAHMQRLASAECKRRYADEGVQIERVEARQVSTKVPPYGLRHAAPEPDGAAIVFPPMDYVEVDL